MTLSFKAIGATSWVKPSQEFCDSVTFPIPISIPLLLAIALTVFYHIAKSNLFTEKNIFALNTIWYDLHKGPWHCCSIDTKK